MRGVVMRLLHPTPSSSSLRHGCCLGVVSFFSRARRVSRRSPTKESLKNPSSTRLFRIMSPGREVVLLSLVFGVLALVLSSWTGLMSFDWDPTMMPEDPATRPQYLSRGQQRAAAKQFGVKVAEDQEALFKDNAFSPLAGKLTRLVEFTAVTPTFYNRFVEFLSMLETPRFRFGKYDYREAILSSRFKYAIIAYVSRTQRIVWWHPNSTMIPTTYFMVTHTSGDKGTPGSVWNWTCTGMGDSQYLGSFNLSIEVIGDNPFFMTL